MAIEKAVAHVGAPSKYPLSPGSLEAIVAQRLNRQPAAARQRTTERVTALLRADRADVPKTLARVDLRNAKPVLEQANTLVPQLKITDPASLVLDAPAPQHQATSTASLQAGSSSGLKMNARGIQFRLKKVKCVDETDGFAGTEAADDEISMGSSPSVPTARSPIFGSSRSIRT